MNICRLAKLQHNKKASSIQTAHAAFAQWLNSATEHMMGGQTLAAVTFLVGIKCKNTCVVSVMAKHSKKKNPGDQIYFEALYYRGSHGPGVAPGLYRPYTPYRIVNLKRTVIYFNSSSTKVLVLFTLNLQSKPFISNENGHMEGSGKKFGRKNPLHAGFLSTESGLLLSFLGHDLCRNFDVG